MNKILTVTSNGNHPLLMEFEYGTRSSIEAAGPDDPPQQPGGFESLKDIAMEKKAIRWPNCSD